MLGDVGLKCIIVEHDLQSYCYIMNKFKENIEKGEYNKKNVFYKNFLVLPEIYLEGLKI